MITSDLVRRGVDFDDAYAVARAVRSRLSDRSEVRSGEVRVLVEQELRNTIGPDRLAGLAAAIPPSPTLQVVSKGQTQPFSLGLLARSVCAAGVELDHAYRLAARIEAELRADDVEIPTNYEIVRRMADLLDQIEGPEAARRYRLVRRIHQLPRPLIIYIGGASGTGKSTLAMELAPLLRIFRIIATDTLRQVMRTLFTPAILPALHASSFEETPADEPPDTPLGAARDPELSRRLISSFEEQATRVCVGVRAVVERAISENMSIIVEGVHLHPGLIPFQDLEGSAYQVPLILSTLNEESHRPRFLTRSRRGQRAADRYLQNFPSIRFVHDYLLQQAESYDVPLVDTSVDNPPVDRMMRLVTGMIEHRLPHLARTSSAEPAPHVPTLMLFIDGLADRPVRALGGRTPLQAASLPTLDRLALEGCCGTADSVGPGIVPDTAAGSLAAFGQSPVALKRGPVEALGAGIDLLQGDLALRANFATVDDEGKIIDRRAGRIRKGAAELAEALNGMVLPGISSGEIEVLVRPSTEHRIAVVFRGAELSSAIQGSDPGEGTGAVPPLYPRPVDPDDEQATRTAKFLGLFEEEAGKILSKHPVNRTRLKKNLPPANIVLTRGAGQIHHLAPLEREGIPLRLACISGDRTIRGIAMLLGAETFTRRGMTANLDTDLGAKFEIAAEALGHCDLVVLHVKGADIAAHDRRPDLKVEFLEKIDRHLAALLEGNPGPVRIVVASDHATFSESGQHGADPLPVLVWGNGVEADGVERFDEPSAGGGSLGRFPLPTLLWRLFGID